MSRQHDGASHGGDDADLQQVPPQAGFRLYRHKNAANIETKGWHGYYWARRTYEGDYEILSVPSSLGERPVPGGVFPRAAFEKLYEEVVP